MTIFNQSELREVRALAETIKSLDDAANCVSGYSIEDQMIIRSLTAALRSELALIAKEKLAEISNQSLNSKGSPQNPIVQDDH